MKAEQADGDASVEYKSQLKSSQRPKLGLLEQHDR